jgi:hypothetical protein
MMAKLREQFDASEDILRNDIRNVVQHGDVTS